MIRLSNFKSRKMFSDEYWICEVFCKVNEIPLSTSTTSFLFGIGIPILNISCHYAHCQKVSICERNGNPGFVLLTTDWIVAWRRDFWKSGFQNVCKVKSRLSHFISPTCNSLIEMSPCLSIIFSTSPRQRIAASLLSSSPYLPNTSSPYRFFHSPLHPIIFLFLS